MFDDPLARPFLDESHKMFYESCVRFTREELLPNAYDWEEAEIFPRELYQKAAEAGLLGASMPEAYGGGGGDIFHLIMFCEAGLLAGSTGILVGLGSMEIALPPILSLGTEEQKQRWVPPVLRGEKIAALGVTEPNTGSDVAGVRTRAVRDGGDYILHGSKMFITSGVRADLVTVLARTSDDPHTGLSFFVVEKGTPGFSASKGLKKMGWRASDTAILSFEDCRIPAENRLGEEGMGFVALMQNFERERLLLATYGHASAAVALAEAERYAREREAFGRSVMGFQVTRHKLARMATLVHACRALNYQVADATRRGEQVLEQVCAAKNFACDVALEVCDHAVQVFGGMGYMRESVVERLYRDVRLLPIGGGTSEIMNEIIAKLRGYGR
ncbi:MAG: acyl-CoA dehydrogenase family protein [Myxococcales bacterium]|nr:acyl-CoA dehydrogenase family protein [Myxococcales bacterium]MCB9643451.1 acyl-CoA dehydrogenase family protein [Myxococcales bacterium]